MLSRQIALVTGVSRGIGRGIALQLAEKGATVYATALPPEKEDRVVKSVADHLPTLEQTLEEIQLRGGKGIGMYVDHGESDEVRRLFERIRVEQDGRLDLLVNNAFPAVTLMLRVMHTKFFKLPEDVYDKVNYVGLRGHYICARRAAQLMVPRRRGLIITTSSPGGLRYMFNVAYGINKACCDRMAADMAVQLREYNVASVSLWPGAVSSELFTRCGLLHNASVEEYFRVAESTEMVGKCVAALAADEQVMEKTGYILTDMELAREYGLYEGGDGEVEGEECSRKQPFDMISFKHMKFLRQLNEIRREQQLQE